MKRKLSNLLNKLTLTQKRILKYTAISIFTLLIVVLSNLYLQWCQNDLSVDLALNFAFSWHTQKFLLACLVLLMIFLLLV